MLRSDRPRFSGEFEPGGATSPAGREVLLAVAPPPKNLPYPAVGWPEWLIPAYRSGGHRPIVRLLEEER